MRRRVRTVVRPAEGRLHLFQAVRERATGRTWVVVDLDDEITLASPDLDFRRTVSIAEFEDGSYEPLTAGDVPIWGY